MQVVFRTFKAAGKRVLNRLEGRAGNSQDSHVEGSASGKTSERACPAEAAELVELSSPPTRAAELVELSSPPTRLVHCVLAGSLVDLQCAAELVVLSSPPTRSVHATAAAARAEALAWKAIAKLPAAAQAAAHPPPRPGAVQPAAAGAAAPPGFKTGRGAARQR